MKKHKKLSLKKVNIATISNTLKIRGGATDTQVCDPHSTVPANCFNATYMRGCIVTDPYGNCAPSYIDGTNCQEYTLICDETTTGRGEGSI